MPDNDGLRDTLHKVQAASEERAMHLAAAQLRKFLSTALCAVCGDPLGDGEIIQNQSETKTMHADCTEEEDE